MVGNCKIKFAYLIFFEREKSQKREGTGRREERNGAKGEREVAVRERGKGGKKMGKQKEKGENHKCVRL